ncbi:MAG: hypothetical protein ABIH03_02335 [Pseudomonadota bacterium]
MPKSHKVDARRKKVVDLMLKDYPAAKIGTMLGISQAIARGDMKAILKKWTDDELGAKAETLRAREVIKLNTYERALKEGFDALTAKGKYSSAAYLYDRIHRIIMLRAELLGLMREKHDREAERRDDRPMVFLNVENEGGVRVSASDGKYTQQVKISPKAVEAD